MGKVKLQTAKTKDEAAKQAAAWFISAIKEAISKKQSASVVVPTGGSPAAFYNEITTNYVDALDWSLVEWITLDELYGVPYRHKATFRSQLRESLFQHLSVPLVNVVALSSEAENLDEECGRFTLLSSEADVVILGVGADGHIGMNFPPSSVKENFTHLVELPEEARPSAALFGEGESVPTQGLTMGLKEILSGKSILLLVDGEKKADALEQLLNGKTSDEWPVTHLRTHKDVQVFASEDAIK